MGQLLAESEGCAGLGVVEDEAAAGGLRGDEGESSAEGFEGEVGDDSEPGEEGGVGGVVAGGGELGGEGSGFEVRALKIDGDAGEVWRRWQGGGGEELALPLLGGGVIHLEDAEVRVVVAVGKGVEARAEEDVLGDGLIRFAHDCLGEEVFGVAAAGDQKGAEGDGEGAGFKGWIESGSAGKFFRMSAEDGDGDGVFEDEGACIVELVGGSAKGHAKSGAGGARFLHLS